MSSTTDERSSFSCSAVAAVAMAPLRLVAAADVSLALAGCAAASPSPIQMDGATVHGQRTWNVRDLRSSLWRAGPTCHTPSAGTVSEAVDGSAEP